jgi:hypothetical protein
MTYVQNNDVSIFVLSLLRCPKIHAHFEKVNDLLQLFKLPLPCLKQTKKKTNKILIKNCATSNIV